MTTTQPPRVDTLADEILDKLTQAREIHYTAQVDVSLILQPLVARAEFFLIGSTIEAAGPRVARMLALMPPGKERDRLAVAYEEACRRSQGIA